MNVSKSNHIYFILWERNVKSRITAATIAIFEKSGNLLVLLLPLLLFLLLSITILTITCYYSFIRSPSVRHIGSCINCLHKHEKSEYLSPEVKKYYRKWK